LHLQNRSPPQKWWAEMGAEVLVSRRKQPLDIGLQLDIT